MQIYIPPIKLLLVIYNDWNNFLEKHGENINL